MFEWFIALIFLNQPQIPPRMIEPAVEREQCLKRVGELSKQNELDLSRNKAELVCLKVVRNMI